MRLSPVAELDLTMDWLAGLWPEPPVDPWPWPPRDLDRSPTTRGEGVLGSTDRRGVTGRLRGPTDSPTEVLEIINIHSN